jgi:GntR family transcriptional regulator, transcriptional repressor for pyruvate dehydrogenase complex
MTRREDLPVVIPSTDNVETLAVLGPIARSSVVDAVADRIRGEILAGRLPAGSRLPSERELSLALGVNRLTLRASLARLEALGLVTTRHGSGTQVAAWQERASLDALATLAGTIKPAEPAWRKLLTAMLEVRRILASEAIGLAAERHTEADIEALTALAAEQATRIHDAVAFARGEIAFERAVIRAAGNVGLELILNSFARFPDEHPELVEMLFDRMPESRLLYESTIALIQSRDAASARDTVRRALEQIDTDWQARHFPEAREPSVAAKLSGRPKPKAKLRSKVRTKVRRGAS